METRRASPSRGDSFFGRPICRGPSARHPRLAALTLLFLTTLPLGFLALSPAFILRAEEAPAPSGVATAVDTLLGRIEEREGPQFWASVAKLEALGKDVVPLLRTRLPKGSEKARLASATVILRLAASQGVSEGKVEAASTLKDLLEGATSRGVRVEAMEVLGSYGDPDEVLPALQKVFESAVDPAVVIPLARILWDLDRVPKARNKLIDFLGSKDIEVKEEAALTLAEIDYFEGDVRDVIRTLKDEPTPRGRRAADIDRVLKLSRQLDRSLEKGEVVVEGTDTIKLLKIKEERIRELEEKVERVGSAGSAGSLPKTPADAVLEEVILQIQKSYVDESKTDRKRLILSALRGMVKGLDEFSSFMDVEDTKSFRQSISGEYFGIGAQVNKTADGPLEILKPIYGGPAYKSGILSGDRVLEVEGVRTDDLQIDEVIEKLKGPAESKVKLKVFRRGWDDPREFVVERRMVEVPSVYSELLPGKIGYVIIQQFGEKSADEFTQAVDSLQKDDMAGLILDVRNDPGGLLEAAVKVVDQFVSGSLPIVTQKGRGKNNSQNEVPTYPDDSARPNYPMVVLVNQRSASASEIVAGALQDFGRATLVGKRTFGKGSVQRLIPLSSEAKKVVGGESQIRLTVQYYFLPLGRCIHTIRDEHGVVIEEGGVKPDIEVDQEKIPAWRAEERERLRSHSLVLEYVDKHFNEISSLFADGDGRDPAKYPGFEDLYKALETFVPREDLRSVLRFHVRRRLEDARGKEFACDFQEDNQLQRGILEILKKMGEKPEDYPRYAALLESSKQNK